VHRKLTFYQWQPITGRQAFDPPTAAHVLAGRVAADPQSVIVVGSDTTTAVVVSSVGSAMEPTRFQLMALRDPDNRPLQFAPGEPLAPIDMLAHRYPADVTHVALWPDGYAAQDSYGHSPRLGRLSHYLRTQANAYVNFEQLYEPDMLARLQDIQGQLRGVDIALTRPEHVDQDPGVFETLIPAVYGSRAPSISVHLGMGRYGARDRYLDAQIEEATYSIAERAHELVDSMVITGRSRTSGRTERVNLLSERLGVERELPRSTQGGSMPDTDATFVALDEAYRDLRERQQLDRAIRAQMMRPRR